ncbi:MAG: PrgI family protein [Candidatus Liptonbacteria bacterium]|nr:PrgI family protein [Candidatus Liptonbacteria bacterium]
MAQFQVPQFIEIEQKIIAGRMTLKQFILVCAGILVAFGLFFVLYFITWIILTTILAAAVLALGFLKIGGRPLLSILSAAFVYYWNPSFYLWQSEEGVRIEIPKIETKIHKVHEEKTAGEEYIRPQLPREFTARPEVKLPAITEKKFAPPASPAAYQDKEARAKVAGGRELQNLWERISTSKLALPKRERAINFFLKDKARENYEILRKATGEMEVAKRVDFK